MAMTVSCPSCNKALRIGEENQGKKMRCPSCQQIFKAPMLSGAEEEAPASTNPFSDLDAPEPRRPRRDEDDYDDRPSRRRDEPEDDRPSRRRDEFEDDRPSRRRGRDDEYNDRPSRRPVRDDRDEYDDRPSRRRDDDDEDYRRPPPRGNINSTPAMVMGILSCVLCCTGIIGFGLGLAGMLMANSALNNVPRGSEYQSERGSLQTAKTVSIIGMCLSGGLFVLGCIVNIAGSR